MAEVSRTKTEITALVGTRFGNLTMFAENVDPHYEVEDRWKNRVTDLLALLAQLEVFKDDDLTFGVRAGNFMDGDTLRAYAGTTGEALTDNDTNYIYLTSAAVLTINTTGFPVPSATAHIPLATIVTSGSVYAIADITDFRERSLWSILS